MKTERTFFSLNVCDASDKFAFGAGWRREKRNDLVILFTKTNYFNAKWVVFTVQKKGWIGHTTIKDTTIKKTCKKRHKERKKKKNYWKENLAHTYRQLQSPFWSSLFKNVLQLILPAYAYSAHFVQLNKQWTVMQSISYFCLFFLFVSFCCCCWYAYTLWPGTWVNKEYAILHNNFCRLFFSLPFSFMTMKTFTCSWFSFFFFFFRTDVISSKDSEWVI